VQTLRKQTRTGRSQLGLPSILSVLGGKGFLGKAINARDKSERATISALLGRFYAQSGYPEEAGGVFRSLELEDSKSLDSAAEFWSSISRAYFEYEIMQDFDFCGVLLERAIHAGQNQSSQDIQVLVTSAHWRLSGIELSRNQMELFRKHQDIAFSRANDQSNPHEIGIVRLSRGYAYLAQNVPNLAYDEFLQGLYLVGYEGIPVPHFLHAELVLGLVIAQSEIRPVRPVMTDAVDEFTALARIIRIFSLGTGRFVTPYSNFRAVDPRAISASLLNNSSYLRRKALLIRKRSLRDLTATSSNGLLSCRSSSKLSPRSFWPRSLTISRNAAKDFGNVRICAKLPQSSLNANAPW
jgi:hypothetical protein